jgi:hypothetical protein
MVTALVLLYIFWTIPIVVCVIMALGFLISERDSATLLGVEPRRRELLLVTPQVIGAVPMVLIIVGCFFWPIALVIALVKIPLRNRQFHRS